MEIKIFHKFLTLNEYIKLERIPKRGRFIANNAKQKDTDEAMKQALEYGFKAQEKKYNVKFTWLITNLKSDPDNISFGKKAVLDGIVKAGILFNDTHKYINSLHDEFKKSNKHGVIIRLEEV